MTRLQWTLVNVLSHYLPLVFAGLIGLAVWGLVYVGQNQAETYQMEMGE